MSTLLWGKVYYQDDFAGFLKQEPGNRYVFTYDEHYLAGNHPPIAHAFPLTSKPFMSEYDLPPFFDNLIAEGWMETAQKKLLGKRAASRFELLLAFGRDCAGAVSVLDPNPVALHAEKLDHNDQNSLAFMRYRASLSGIQPKLFLVRDKKIFRLAHAGEISTHIAKLSSLHLDDIIENEWLTLSAARALLPQDDFVDAQLSEITELNEPALIIKRFDRTANLKKLHFEEFNQLLNLNSSEKYDGAYKDMADFMYQNTHCLQSDAYRLFKRIIMGLLTGNTDMHFKNLENRLDAAKQAILEEKRVHTHLKNRITQFMEKRWTGTFSLIGQQLLKKR